MIEDKLAQVGLIPPAASKPAFAYVPVTLHDGVAYVNGQLPKIDGEVRVFGKVGREVTPDAGARSIGEAFTSLTGDGREGGEW
jgi:enamine deaminase RidA (YjgF/YER057c/UK114 family)